MDRTLGRDDMVRHAQDWIAAWNRHDLDAVLDAYAEDACFRSPRATAITGSSLLVGRSEMEGYWRAALDKLRMLEFTFLSAVCDVEEQTVVVHYLAALDGPRRRACEIFHFEAGRKVYGEALYGDVESAEKSARPMAVHP
jgi:steroid delta-isomerase